MSFLFKGLLALFWLLAIPAASGVLFFRKKEALSLSDCLLSGCLFLFSAAQLLTLPAIFFKLSLRVLVFCFALLSGLAAVSGLFCALRRIRKKRSAKESGDLQTDALRPEKDACLLRRISPYFAAAVFIIAIQIIIVVRYAHFDADDAFYVATGTTSVETDSVFLVNAYTGVPYQTIPRRYILSPFPVFLAVISRLSGGLHPAIMAHTVFPAVFLIFVYIVMYRLAQRWFPQDRNARGIFLFLTAILSWFSSYSVYNTGAFQMVRLWQGKAVLAAFLLPLIFYLCLSTILEQEPRYPWLLLFMANLSCCLLTSMGILLAPLMMGIFVLLGLLRFRSLKRTAAGLICCLPSIVLGIVYILI